MRRRLIHRLGLGLMAAAGLATLVRTVLLAPTVGVGVVIGTIVVLVVGSLLLVAAVLRHARLTGTAMIEAQQAISATYGVRATAALVRAQSRPALLAAVGVPYGAFPHRWFLISVDSGSVRFWQPTAPGRVAGEIALARIGEVTVWTELISGFEHHRLGVVVDAIRIDLILGRPKGRSFVSATRDAFSTMRDDIQRARRDASGLSR